MHFFARCGSAKMWARWVQNRAPWDSTGVYIDHWVWTMGHISAHNIGDKACVWNDTGVFHVGFIKAVVRHKVIFSCSQYYLAFMLVIERCVTVTIPTVPAGTSILCSRAFQNILVQAYWLFRWLFRWVKLFEIPLDTFVYPTMSYACHSFPTIVRA